MIVQSYNLENTNRKKIKIITIHIYHTLSKNQLYHKENRKQYHIKTKPENRKQ